MAPRRRRLLEKLRSLYLWHRYAGLVAALLVAWLAVTGIFLNHADDLDLANSHVRQDWLLDAYSIQPAQDLRGYAIANHWITSSGNLLYIDDQRLHIEEPLVAAAETDFGFVLAFARRLQLYTEDAVLVETLPFTASSAQITDIRSTAKGGLVITTETGSFLADSDLATFNAIDRNVATTIPATTRQELPRELASRIATDIRHHTLDWERVMLDLHSGRILGSAGIWLADIAAGLMLLLAISGVLVWFRRWRSRRQRRHE